MTRYCHRCGWVWQPGGQPGRSEACGQCEADLRVCLNCVFYDPKAAQQCRERRADPVGEKDRANYCEWFDFRRGVFSRQDGGFDRAQAARDQLKRLLGD